MTRPVATNRKKLLIPQTMARAGWDVLTRRDDIEAVPYDPLMPTAEFRAALADIDGIALALTRFGPQEIAAAPKLRVVARIGVGFDTVDIPALSARKLPLMTVGIANSVTVAENAMMLMFALAKRTFALDRMVREGRWQERWNALPFDLFKKTVLIIGFGRIGTRMARRCLALEMNVLVHDPYLPATQIAAAGCEPVADLDAALPRADFVTIHCPKSPETTKLFDAARLARLKPSAYLINTARGGIVDEAALHAALTSGRLAGAGIDVFEKEPAAGDNPLFRLDAVVVGPHIAGVTHESVDRMAVATARNILSVLDGMPNKENCVNGEVLG